jgi:hypothetical protein
MAVDPKLGYQRRAAKTAARALNGSLSRRVMGFLRPRNYFEYRYYAQGSNGYFPA